jgi:hypothetical protein
MFSNPCLGPIPTIRQPEDAPKSDKDGTSMFKDRRVNQRKRLSKEIPLKAGMHIVPDPFDACQFFLAEGAQVQGRQCLLHLLPVLRAGDTDIHHGMA